MADTAAIWMLPGRADRDTIEIREGRYERIALLFAAWRHGDIAAFETLMAELHPTAYRVAWRLLGNAADAEDAVQETFLRFYRAAGSVRNAAQLPALVYRIAVNASRSQRNRVLRRSEANGAWDASTEPVEPAPSAAESLLLREAIHGALQDLSHKEREAVVLRDIEGLDLDEVAAAMGVFQVTVRTHLSRGRMKLRKLLTERGITP